MHEMYEFMMHAGWMTLDDDDDDDDDDDNDV